MTTKFTSPWRLFWHRGSLPLFCLSAISNLLILTGPLFMLQIYDRVLASRSIPTLLGLLALAAMLFIFLAIIDALRMRLLATIGFSRLSIWQDNAINKTLEQPKSGAMAQLSAIELAYRGQGLLAYLDALWIPLFLIVLTLIHPQLGFFAVIAAVILVSITAVNQWHSAHQLADGSKYDQAVQRFSHQIEIASSYIKAQALGPNFTQRWKIIRDRKARHQNKGLAMQSNLISLGKSFRQFIQAAILALGAYLAIQNQVSPGAIIASSVLLGRMLAPIEQILGSMPVINDAKNAAQKLDTHTPTKAQNFHHQELGAEISVRKLGVFSADNKSILQDINFDIKAGQGLGVIGLSASGKSSLAKTLLGVIAHQTGEVRFGGVEIEQLDSAQRRSHIGYLPQELVFFDGRLDENIAQMQLEFDEAKIIEAAKSAHAHEMILSFPDGYNTVIDAQNPPLSGGQKQRLALARALFGNPKILILDEPNSALDEYGVQALNHAISEHKSNGGSVIIMTHRPNALGVCEELLVLDGGRVRAFGPRQEVMRSVLQPPPNQNRTREAGAA